VEKKSLNSESGKESASNGNFRYFDPKLISVAQRAYEGPKEKFNNLLHHLTVERVEQNILSINRWTGKGPDGLSRDLTAQHLDWLLPKELEAIHKKKYKPPASRRVYIPKARGGKRPLAVGNVLDRGLQGAITDILNHVYEQDFLDCSFGFRPGRGAHNALATLDHTVMYEKNNYLLEVDIRNFFGAVDHGWMMEFLRHRISDSRVLTLIESWLKAGIIEDGKEIVNDVGTAQGGAISPLLANVYLHYVLDLWFDKKIKPRLREGGRLIRYCDDFVVAFKNLADLRDFKVLLVSRLKQFGLEIAEEKTHETYLGARKKDYKGPKLRRAVSFLGFTVYSAKKWKGQGIRVTFKTDRSRFAKGVKQFLESLRKMMHLPLENQARWINSVLRGHFNYYGLPGNAGSLNRFRNIVLQTWRKVLSKRSQNTSVSWGSLAKRPFLIFS
jgi:RNA-directed DNA polymerase